MMEQRARPSFYSLCDKTVKGAKRGDRLSWETVVDGAIVIGYVALLAGMALWSGRRVKSGEDFTAGEKKYGPWVIFATLSASYVGGGYSSGNAAAAFSTGIGTTCTLLGFSVSMIYIARKLVPGVEKFAGVSTVGGVMEQMYGRRARVVTGWLSFLCCAGVVGAQMQTMGVVLNQLTGLHRTMGVLIGAVVVLAYTTFGGLQSVIVADILQFILMAVGMPLLLFAGVRACGGWGALWEAIPPAYWHPLNSYTPAAFVSVFLAMALGEALAPPYTQRLLVGQNAAATAKGTLWSGLFSVPFFVMTGMIGLVAFALKVTPDSAQAMPALIHAVLPVGARGVVLAAMVSILLSASDSFLNSATIGLIADGVTPWCPLSERQQLWGMRAANVATGLVGVAMALLLEDVFSILMTAYAFWCPLLLAPLAAAFAGWSLSRKGFWLGLSVGLVAMLLWNFGFKQPAGVDGGVVGLLCNSIVCTLFPRTDHEKKNVAGRL